MPSEVVKLTGIQCPRYAHCHGFLQVLRNENGKFLGCTSRQVACANLVKIAHASQQCIACCRDIIPVPHFLSCLSLFSCSRKLSRSTPHWTDGFIRIAEREVWSTSRLIAKCARNSFATKKRGCLWIYAASRLRFTTTTALLLLT